MKLRNTFHHVGLEHARVVDLVLWYLIGAALVFVLPSMERFDAPPWEVSQALELQSWHWAVTFLVAAFGVTLYRAVRGQTMFWMVVVLCVWPCVFAALALVLRPEVGLSRWIALESVLLGGFFISVPALIPARAMRFLTRSGAVVVIAAGLTASARAMKSSPPAPLQSTAVVNTALVPLAVTYQKGLLADSGRIRGGAIAPLESGFLLATAAGNWYAVNFDSARGGLTTRRVGIPAPMPRPERMVVEAGAPTPLLRVTDVLIDGSAAEVTVYVVHEVWREAEGCVVMQVSTMRLRKFEPVDSAWRPIYSTQPCVKPRMGFDRVETGGRLVQLPDKSLLLAVGDYGLSHAGANAPSQQPDGDYGKILRIGLDGRRSLHTMGHRNPSGLAIDGAGRVWEVEHGPKGGDEINLIERGANYGWPVATYGTDYAAFSWRSTLPTASHSPFHEPSLALVPAPAISGLIVVRGQHFASWGGDLLAGSLEGERLLRVRLAGDRVVYAEEIAIGRRIRDLAEGFDGRIVMLTEEGQLVWLSHAVTLPGFVAYQACGRCHGYEREGAKNGPHLKDLIGRQVASTNFEYSAALKARRGRWTRDRLEEFLRNPSGFAPGTTMPSPALSDSIRRVLLEYLIK